MHCDPHPTASRQSQTPGSAPACLCLPPDSFFSPIHSLEISSLKKTIRITAKSTKRIREALQPVLGKYGVSLELVLLRRVSTDPASCERDPGGKTGLGLGPGAADSVGEQWSVLQAHGGMPVLEMGHGTTLAVS